MARQPTSSRLAKFFDGGFSREMKEMARAGAVAGAEPWDRRSGMHSSLDEIRPLMFPGNRVGSVPDGL